MLSEEKLSNGEFNRFYLLNGQVVAMRKQSSLGTSVTYLHGDHLGSLSAATSAGGVVQGRQEYTPWGAQRGSGQITQTVLDFTGQRKDKDFSGLVFLNARYYDPVLGRFISGDSIVPGASGGVIGQDSEAKLTPLTVDFREPAFASTVGEENRLVLGKGFLDKETVHTGPANPQALNRYSYVMNNPLKYTDPTGHQCGTATPDSSCGGSGSVPGNGVRRGNGTNPGVGSRISNTVRRFFDWLRGGGSQQPLLGPGKPQLHHIMPQQRRSWFARRGINIDDFTIELERTTHLRGVHGKGGFVGPGSEVLQGHWNQRWADFIRSNPNATADDVYKFAGQLMDEFGLNNIPIVPYK